MDKTKFTANPQLDSEGFVMADARCHGCAPHDPCSRSGHCERYDSPLRFTDATTFAAQYKGLSVLDGHVKVGGAS